MDDIGYLDLYDFFSVYSNPSMHSDQEIPVFKIVSSLSIHLKNIFLTFIFYTAFRSVSCFEVYFTWKQRDFYLKRSKLRNCNKYFKQVFPSWYQTKFYSTELVQKYFCYWKFFPFMMFNVGH